MNAIVKQHRCVCRLFGIAVVAVIVLGGAEARGGKPPQPPVTPPVYYDLHWLDTLGHSDGEIGQMNSAGEVVGCVFDREWIDGSTYRINKRAFLDSPDLGSIDLNDIMVGALAGNWIAEYALSINDLGQIAGRVNATDSESYRGFVYDLYKGTTILLPPPPSGGKQVAKRINLWGDVVATEERENGRYIAMYHPIRDGNGNITAYGPGASWQLNTDPTAFNSGGQILLQNGMRYTPGVGWQDFKVTHGVQSASAMNEDGTFVGTRIVTERRTGTKMFAFRFQDPNLMLNLAQDSYAYAVNLQGDVCLNIDHRGYMYYSDRSGVWALDKAVPDDSAWKAAGTIWPKGIADHSSTTAGAICGDALYYTTSVTTQIKPFFLTPR